MTIGNPDHEERRDFIRMHVDCDIVYRVVGISSSGEHEHGRTRNLSGNGILFLARREFKKGEVLDISVQSKSPNIQPLEARVVVVRATLADRDEGLYEVAAIMQVNG